VNVRFRREGDIGQPAEEGPVSDPKATFDDAALTGSFCPFSAVPRPWPRSAHSV